VLLQATLSPAAGSGRTAPRPARPAPSAPLFFARFLWVQNGHRALVAQQPDLPLPPAASSPTKAQAGTTTRLHRQPSCSQPAGRPAATVPTGSQSEDYSWLRARSVCEPDNRSRRNHRRRDATACRTYARQRGVVHVRALPCKPRVGKHAPQARHGSDGHGGGGSPGALPAVRLRCALL